MVPDMDRIIDDYGNSLFRMCFLYLKDLHMAEDALQDTFIKVYRNYWQYKGNSKEKTWIMSIAINVCKNYKRKTWWKFVDESAVLENILTYEDPIGEDNTLLLEIMKLSPKYKEVILLFYYQDMKIREIAETLQISQATVSTRLKRGRERLKDNLGEWFYDE